MAVIAAVGIGALALFGFKGGFGSSIGAAPTAIPAPKTASEIQQEVLAASTSPLTQTLDWAYSLSIASEFPTQTTQEIYNIIEYNRRTQTESLLDKWLAANGF